MYKEQVGVELKDSFVNLEHPLLKGVSLDDLFWYLQAMGYRPWAKIGGIYTTGHWDFDQALEVAKKDRSRVWFPKDKVAELSDASRMRDEKDDLDYWDRLEEGW